MKPVCIDLFCGLGGWSEGFLAEGYECIGFDIERHDYGTGGYPGQLVIQDALTLHGSQFRNAAVIVASPPCQEYSYMAMPWSLAKKKRAEYLSGERDVADLTRLFDACFRIQREACEAAGRHIPMVVENVRGAQEWVGRAKWRYGSFYFWGDVPALMPIAKGAVKVSGLNWSGSDKPGYKAEAFNSTAARRLKATGVKVYQADWIGTDRKKRERDSSGWAQGSSLRQLGSGDPARKAASAQIAKIPYDLARWIAQTYRPVECVA